MDRDIEVRNAVLQSTVGSVVQTGDVHGDVHLHQVTVPPAAPRQLPPRPSHFTNRVAEIATLDQALENRSDHTGPVVVVVTGSGGIGKTALAVEWLHRRADRFPDAQLFADLSAFGADVAPSAGEVLGRLLRGLGLSPPEIPLAESERAALFRSVTVDKAFAMLLDDAASTKQVRTLLPASSNGAVVVTSRWRLSGLAMDGARVVTLGPLDTTSALDLLSKAVKHDRVAAEPGAARELATLCAGMPIALQIVGARLAALPRRRLTRVVEELTDERRRLGALTAGDGSISMAASFDLSYRALPPSASRLYRLMALHPGPEFGSGVAAAAIGVDVGQAEELLDVLVRANVLADIADDRYRFHDLVRLHALGCAEAQDSESQRLRAVRAMVSWYLDRAVAADVVLTPLRWHLGDRYRRRFSVGDPDPMVDGAIRSADPVGALEMLEDGLANFIAVARTAFRHEWDELVWQLSEALWGLFLYRSHYPEWIAICELGARAAARCGNSAAESRMLIQLAAAYLRLGQTDKAYPLCDRAWQLSRAAMDWRGEATGLENLGSIAHAQGRLQDAIDFYRRSLAISERYHQERGVALLLCYLGYAMHDIGDDIGACASFRRSVAVADSIDDRHGRALALVGLGTVYAQQEMLDRAIDVLTEGLMLLDAATVPALCVGVLTKLGEISRQAGHLAAARDHWQRAVELYEELGDPQVERVRALMASLPTIAVSVGDRVVPNRRTEDGATESKPR